MDANTSGEELLTKARKPYTITKQRERWTDDEHDRFLEALRLYGRAWQRIEEHIGTKTAVQIRSHAQKFFTKLEKEAEAKGIPVCQALDIEIPPPRPKRKPNTPYPRKPGNGNNNNNNGASSSKLASSSTSSSHCNLDLEKTPFPEKLDGGQNQEDNCSGVSTLHKSSLPKNPNPENPAVQQNKDRDSENSTMNYPWHVPVHDFMFRPMGDHHSQDDYRSFLQISSTFSNLVVSTLLQNPAAHAAATYAASAWPYAAGDSSSSSPPSIAAIAAATVAAATAWWASHGLLPPPPPPPTPTPITCLPIPTFTVPMDTDETEKQNTALQDKNLAPASSDYSEETGVTKLKDDSKTDMVEEEEEEEVDVVVVADMDDSETQKKKLVDRSSCGSNTPSGSDAEETDKTEKDNKEDLIVKETTDVMELSNRRSSKINNNNNNNNQISEEGRIAFQALFARERLPQSFSPPLEAENVKSSMSIPMIQDSSSCDATEQVVMIGGKSVKTRQTGFKPYKRCSMEAKESQVGNTNDHQSDEKVCKRLRLEEEEASTTT